MAMKFAANLNFLFAENGVNLVERIQLAHRAGFRGVEIPYPQGCDTDVIKVKKETGIEVALINIALGNDNLKLGSASIPGEEKTFEEQLSKTISFAKAVECKKIHIMAGLVQGQPTPSHLETYKNNLKKASKLLAAENLVGVIEPINKYAVPGYFMNCYDKAIDVLTEVNSPNLKLMLDIFHLQHIKGNVSHTFKELGNWIGHIQIAQVPNRNEPDSDGELNFKYIFCLIKQNYSDWIGCEYKPQTTTAEGLKWLKTFNLAL